jgi:phage shock protein PspC (stress-responsive transcriptional regulator)
MAGILAGLARVYGRAPRAVPLIRLAVVVGVFVCACFIGVAVTPENRVRSTHVLFTKLAFRAFPAVPLLLGLAASRSDRMPPRVGIAWITMVVLLAAYVVVLDWGPRASTPIGLVVQVTAQKIVAVGAVLLLVYQSIQAGTQLDS